MDQLLLKTSIQHLDNASGQGTSMISLIISPKDSIVAANRLLTEEHGAASNIKSRVNRQSVQWAITSAQQKLKLFPSVPPNGLVVYCGEVNADKPISIAFEPPKPLNTFKYLCENHFYTDPLKEMLFDPTTYGFVIVDGNGMTIFKVTGHQQDRVAHFAVSLPTKSRRGGQSALRFSRLRDEAFKNYVRKIGEALVQTFISDNTVNVEGIYFCGSGDIKNEVFKDTYFDPRIQRKVIKIVDIQYGGNRGLQEALGQLKEELADLPIVKEKKLLQQYFEHLAKDTGLIAYGKKDTLECLQEGLVEMLMLWEDTDESFIEEVQDVLEQFKSPVEIISNKTTEGAQFVNGFGGIGAILRYPRQTFDESDDYDSAVSE